MQASTVYLNIVFPTEIWYKEGEVQVIIQLQW